MGCELNNANACQGTDGFEGEPRWIINNQKNKTSRLKIMTIFILSKNKLKVLIKT